MLPDGESVFMGGMRCCVVVELVVVKLSSGRSYYRVCDQTRTTERRLERGEGRGPKNENIVVKIFNTVQKRQKT